MAVRVAINGFGRIGRLVLRALVESGRKDIEVVAINDLGPVATNAHLLKYDSVHGILPADVSATENSLVINGTAIRCFGERDPNALKWGDLGIDIVAECTGIFSDRDKAAIHLNNGAKRVLVSAPSKGADLTVVYGVNHQKISASHTVISNASCTTNCLAPVAHVLHREFGIVKGFMTTIHAYTGDQNTVDTLHKDLYRARAAAMSMIPTSTGAAKAVGEVLPDLKGKLDGVAVRVPTANVSLVDLKVMQQRSNPGAAVFDEGQSKAREADEQAVGDQHCCKIADQAVLLHHVDQLRIKTYVLGVAYRDRPALAVQIEPPGAGDGRIDIAIAIVETDMRSDGDACFLDTRPEGIEHRVCR